MHKTPLKNISVALVTAFLLQDAAWAAPEISIRPDHKLELSSEFSKISDEYRGSIPKRIIHIQDAHTNLSAQKNMAKVIEELVSRHHIQTVFVEGGTQDDSLTSLRPLADKSTRERVAKKYMMQGEMAGEEYLNLVSDLDFKIQGVEELSLYKKNLEYYRSLAASREKIFGYLHEIEKRAESLKRQLYPGHLLALDALAEKFEKKEADFTTYLDVLSDEAKKAGVNVLGYPQLLALGELKAKESQIDFQKANEEQMALFKAIQKTDPAKAQELKKIAGKTQKLRFQSTELGAFYESLIKEAGRNSVPVPQLEKYADYLGFYSRLHFESLLLEIEQIQNEIFGKALSNGDAYSLYETSIYLKKLSKLFSLQATRNDVDAYVESRKDARFRTVTVVAFLNRALYDLNREAEVLTYDSIIEDNLKTVEGFYEATRERDEVFVKKALEQMDRDKLSSAALITGGYHTGNLKKLLQERGVSYTVVTPHVFEETNMKRYEKLLLSQFGGAASLVQSPSLNFQHTKSFMNLVKAVERPGFIERFRFELSAPSMQAAGARLAHQNDKAPDLIERAARFSKPTLESVMQSVYLIAQWLEANGFPEADYVRLYAIAFSNATVMSDNYPGVFTKYIENGSVGLGVNLKKYHEESAYDRMGPNFIAHLVTLIVRESAGYIYI